MRMKTGNIIRMIRDKKHIRKIGAGAVAVALITALTIGLIPNKSSRVLAANKVSDLSTVTKYTESLGDNASTEYAGRIWTDKTVYTEDATLTGYTGSSQTVEIGDADFLVSFSALATAQAVYGEGQAPMDVVFVLDLSGSMSNQSSNMTNDQGVTKSRIAFTVDAVNKAIDDLLKTNPNSRIGVVGFSRQSTTLLELDHYTRSGNQEYFSLSRTTGSSNNATLYTRAVNSNGNTITKSTSVSLGTNIQDGLYDGMNLLATEEDTTVMIDGKEVKRIPSVILLSDGAPTWAMDAGDWWSPSRWWEPSGYGLGDGSDPYPGVGMLAMMTGAYMKNRINENYGVEGTQFETTLYTVGVGIDDLDSDSKALAQVTLNPKDHLDSTTNEYAEDIRGYWERYCRTSNNTPSIQTDGSESYTLTHPSTGDISGDALKTYVDQHYRADDADSIATVFDDIVSDIVISSVKVPTEHDKANPATTGYITYTDPIGKYMEVKDMKAILYAGKQYKAHTVETEGDVTTYTFTETAEGNKVYGSEELSHIIIKATTTTENDGSKSQVLTIQIPASLIPLRVNEVQLAGSEEAGYTVKSHTNNGTYPIRVFYTVGMQEEILDGDVVATHKLNTDYVKANTNADGTINFYSNLYTGKKSPYDNSTTIGDATVTFDADPGNAFYYVQEDILIYENKEFTRVASGVTLDDDTTYYYKEVHYHGTTIETEAVERTGAQLKNNTVVKRYAENGQWYRPKGTVRVNRMLTFEGDKKDNATNTADHFYTPTYNEETGYFVVYLGNNGVMSAVAGGSLAITKEVTAAPGLEIQKDKEFTFQVGLKKGLVAIEGTYVYEVKNEAGEIVSTGTIAHNGTLKLKDGETATIYSLPDNTDYTVTEIDIPSGFTATPTEEAGTIETGVTAQETFTNYYEVTPVRFPSNGSLGGTKRLEGRPWDEAVDEYTFLLEAINNAPLPEDYDADKGVTVTKATAKAVGADTVWEGTFDFGYIEFTQPGTYQYEVVEKEPENNAYIPGISYSRALYMINAVVVDNGNGTLTIQESSIQKLHTDDATPVQETTDEIVFTNTFSAEEVVRVPVAVKSYIDHSGNKPLTSGMFKFKLEAVGENASDAPMPSPNVVENEGMNVTFPGVTFTQSAIKGSSNSTTYTYKMTEVRPEEANETNNYTVNGMKYDPKVVLIEVTVSYNAEKGGLNVNAVYPEGRVATFENEYAPEPVVVGKDTQYPVEGIKTLFGRDMKDGETFDFQITPANAAVSLAIRNGDIVMPADTDASVSGGKNGVEVGFEFDQITFKKPGVYTFNVNEVIPDNLAGGMTYDQHTCAVTITVQDDNGQLKASIRYNNGTGATDNSKAIFVNTYSATFDDSTAISLAGKKVMTGRPIEDGEFFFEVTLNHNGMRANYVPAGTDGAIQFLDKVTYTEAGEYVYVISEVIPNPGRGGVTYDTAKYRITVSVTDDLNGNLTAAITKMEKSLNGNPYSELGANDEITFTNVYKTTPRAVALLGITKTISGTRGEALKAGEFTFKLTLVSGDEEGIELPSATTTTNRADGTVVFGDGQLLFKKPGTYEVRVEEMIPSGTTQNADGTYTKDGITYSTNVIRSTFKVTDDLEGGLVVIRTGTVGSRQFVNTYRTTGTLKGATELVIVKNFTGRKNDEWLDTDRFLFVLEAADEVTQKAVTDGKIVLPDNASGITIDAKDADKKSAFGDIVFHEAGDYTFLIREEAGEIPGVAYDATSRTIKVKAKDQSNGTLLVTATDNDESDLTFRNVYNPGDVVLYGHGNLHVTKLFTGRENDEWLDTDSFRFTLGIDQDHADTVAAKNAGDIVMPSANLTMNHDNKDVAHFGNITFKKAGTYKFVVDEVEGNIPGVKYDASTKTIVVNVTDNADGTMSVTIDKSSDALTFVNKYQPESDELVGQTKLKITKVIDGRKWDANDAFKFLLESGDAFTTENAVISEAELIVKNQGTKMTAVDDYTVETYFGNITLKAAGTYRFRIVEKNSENTQNMAYDRHSTVVIVTVDHNYTEGTLDVSDVSYIGEMTWINKHTPNKINVTLTGTKKLIGRTLTASDKFNFTVEVAEGSKENTPLPSVISLQNLMDEITFGPFTYKEEGVYKYIIREEGYISGVTNDKGYVVATVTVTDENGTLKHTTAYQKMDAEGSETGTKFEFVNTYSSSGTLEGKTNLKVTKNFTGRANDAWLDTDKFEFTLAADPEHNDTVEAVAAGDIMLTAPTIVVNKTNKGDAYFGDITFTKEGQYQFVVLETTGSIDGVNYDKTAKKVIVNVLDKGDGTMAVALTSSSNALTFTNTYEAQATEVSLKGLKKMTGRPLMSTDVFDFTISAVGKAPLPLVKTVQNDAAGNIAFAPITFTKAGVYEYEIKEEVGNIAGVTDATNRVTVTVTVEDKNVGKLEVTSVVYSKAEGDAFVYTNKYTTTQTDGVTIDGLKVVTPTKGNRYTMIGGEFAFEIAPANTNPANDPIAKKQVTNKADGTIPFAEGAIYNQTGTYVYTVHEVSGTVAGIGYDDAKYTVTVVVTDDTTSAKLKAAVTITEDGQAAQLKFDNKYTPDKATAVLYGEKVLDSEHIDLVAEQFEFKLEATGQNKENTPMPEKGKEVVSNDAVGLFQFGTITYDEVGEYTYQITELDKGVKGYTYDATKYAVTVKVTDVGGALKAEVTGIEDQNGEAIVVFTNKYTPDPVILKGETALKGKKVLKGRTLEEGEFTFQLLDKNNTVQKETKNKADGSFTFEPLTFKKADTYYYTVVEENTNLGGVSYDQTVYTIKVEVKDAGGYLKADVTYMQGQEEAALTFTNEYKATPVGIQISAAKALEGRRLDEKEFTFLLKDENGEVVATATNDANGLIVFEEIKYDKEGTYEYTIAEEKGNVKHVTYDDSIYKVTVKVTDDLKGMMEAEVDYHGENPVFKNTYKEPGNGVQTGDVMMITLPLLTLIASAVVLVFTLKKSRNAR